MNIPGFSAERALYHTNGRYCMSWNAASPPVNAFPALAQPLGAVQEYAYSRLLRLVTLKTCDLGCYLRCRYEDNVDDSVCTQRCCWIPWLPPRR